MKYNIPSVIQNPQNVDIQRTDQVEITESYSRFENPSVFVSQNLREGINNEKENLSEIKSEYSLGSNILCSTQISEVNRAKLRLWIFEACRIRSLSCKSASLACSILDSYFSKGGVCKLDKFHEIGISCLRIANKLQQNVSIPVNCNIFDRQSLLHIQNEICFQVAFKLNPPTFTDIIHEILYFWDEFREAIKSEGVKTSKISLKNVSIQMRAKIVQRKFSSKLLFELLQYSLLFLETLSLNLQKLVLNAFYLIFCIQMKIHLNSLTSSTVAKFYKKLSNNWINDEIFDAIKYFMTLFSQESTIINPQFLDIQYSIYLSSIYNSLISEKFRSPIKSEEGPQIFNPNDPIFQNQDEQNLRSPYSQHFLKPCVFKDKLSSLKKYFENKKNPRAQKKSRKLSQITQ